MAQEKISKELKIVYDCFEELYQNSTPKGSFYELKKYAEDNNIKDTYGRTKIPFDDYSIEASKYEEIVAKHEKKMKNKLYNKWFRPTIALGPSPKTIKDNE